MGRKDGNQFYGLSQTGLVQYIFPLEAKQKMLPPLPLPEAAGGGLGAASAHGRQQETKIRAGVEQLAAAALLFPGGSHGVQAQEAVSGSVLGAFRACSGLRF